MKAFTLKTILLAATLAIILSSCEKTEYDERNRFVGRYNVEEYYSAPLNSFANFESRIKKSETHDDEIIITNFYDTGYEVFAIVTGSKIYIDPQTIGIYTFEGLGSLSNNVLTIGYDVTITRPSSTIYHYVEATYLKY